jgi:hypothetical protein
LKAERKDGLFDKVERAIAKIRPALGANMVELVEEQVKEELPEIAEVIAVLS